MANNELTVVDGLVVSLDYTLSLDGGQVIDSTRDEPARLFPAWKRRFTEWPWVMKKR